MNPTAEQEAAITAVRRGQSVKVAAFAGAGKTSCLEMIARAQPPTRRILYLVFNRQAAEDARKRMPANVTAKTIHSLAYGAVGHRMKDRLVNNLLGCRDQALLTCRAEVDAVREAQGPKCTDWQAHELITQVLHNYLCSDAREITADHLPSALGQALAKSPRLQDTADAMLVGARAYWAEMARTGSTMPVTHDVYLKLYALTEPTLFADLLMLDEGQDSNPLTIGIFNQQDRAQKILVGDRWQQLYSFRGAVNAMATIDLPELPLTQSFRFGPAIARQANSVLALHQEQRQIVGLGPQDDAVVEEQDVQASAILGRTNGGLVGEAVRLLDRGAKVAVVGGVNEMASLLRAAYDLFRGDSTAHPELSVFADWMELEEIAETPVGQSYAPLVNLVRRYGAGTPGLANRLRYEVTSDERQADVVLSTAHRAKGRQWESVRLLGDYPDVLTNGDDGAPKLQAEEVNVQYVAQTRARRLLDVGPNGNMLRAAAQKLKGVERSVAAGTDNEQLVGEGAEA